MACIVPSVPRLTLLLQQSISTLAGYGSPFPHVASSVPFGDRRVL